MSNLVKAVSYSSALQSFVACYTFFNFARILYTFQIAMCYGFYVLQKALQTVMQLLLKKLHSRLSTYIFLQLCGNTSFTYLLSYYAGVSSASEFIHSLSCHPSGTFKPHTWTISALAIAPCAKTTLIKVWQQDHQKQDSRSVSPWHCASI